MWKKRIFLSDAVAARRKADLERLDICCVVDLSGGEAYELPAECVRVAIDIDDVADADILPAAERCHEQIDAVLAEPRGSVLVHCARGASRSATCVISWLMTRQHWTLRRALNHCKRRRQEVRPNNGFFLKLRRLDQDAGRDSMPLDALQYARWCLENPRGEPWRCSVQ